MLPYLQKKKAREEPRKTKRSNSTPRGNQRPAGVEATKQARVQLNKHVARHTQTIPCI
jgi:hypothetical protein